MDDPELHQPDVCIIGAGPAGLSLASALGRAGRRVVVLESGDWEASVTAQGLNDGDHEGVAYGGLVKTRHRQVGGTTNIWNVELLDEPGAKYAPLSACDFRDWPFGLDELLPFYRQAQALCGLGPFEYDAGYWSGPERRPFTLSGTGLTSRVYQFGTAERLRERLLEGLTGVTLMASTTATGLSIETGGRLVDVNAVDANGRRCALRPRVAVLAAGAVENARLLLLDDAIRRVPLPWLGRGFMEHARDFSLRLFPDAPELFSRAGFYDLHRGADGTWVGGRLALTDKAVREFGLPNASITLIPRRRPSRPGPLARLLRRRNANRTPQPRYGWWTGGETAGFDAFNLVMNLEQRPRPDNRIELGERRDRFGNRLPKLHLNWSPDEQAELERLRRLLGDWLAASGVGRLQTIEGRPPDLSAHHHAGTTRMAEDPRDGVVDPAGRLFGVDNLYLAGASIFPSAGFANPTLTIVAMALRQGRLIDAALR